ncbi:MAG: sugar transferase [Acutalibacteraceae bacterium]
MKRDDEKIAYSRLKRIFDFLGASSALAVLGLPMLFIALFIKVEGKGPALFKQERPGKNANRFTIYKFRTMLPPNETLSDSQNEAARITELGGVLRKTSLDELPQLFNILKGDMSFIGPRPLLTEYLPLYNSRQLRRHEVLPGLTGLAQVNGRNAITWEEKFEYDVYYVEHLSFLLDLKIFIKTFMNVLKCEGINDKDGKQVRRFEADRESKKTVSQEPF